jgi:DNA-binding LytR/AlgR family response regulator
MRSPPPRTDPTSAGTDPALPAPTAIVADDERLMRDQIVGRLKEAWPELLIVGEAANGREAVDMARSLEPDIAFLDISMPGMDGIEAAQALAGAVHVVFVTAHDEFAIRAFEQGAADYVLKPAEPERLALTCRRLRERLGQAPDPMNDLLAQLAHRLGAGGPKPREYIRWIQASVGANLRMIPTGDILFFRAEDKYTRVQARGFEALIRKPIKELIDELDPKEFWQIHRSIVVRVDAVEQVSRDFRGHQVVHVKGSDERLEVSRTFSHRFKQM